MTGIGELIVALTLFEPLGFTIFDSITTVFKWNSVSYRFDAHVEDNNVGMVIFGPFSEIVNTIVPELNSARITPRIKSICIWFATVS